MKMIEGISNDKILDNLKNNPIIKDFLNDLNNYKLLLRNITDPSSSNKTLLDEAFKNFFFEVRFTTYISSLIRYSSIDFDKKERKIQKKAALILDDTFNNIKFNMTTQESSLDDAEIENITSSSLLYKGLLLLTKKEKEVLEESYIMSLSDTEIARKKNVSQQAISKTRTKALKKLREFLTKKDED